MSLVNYFIVYSTLTLLEYSGYLFSLSGTLLSQRMCAQIWNMSAVYAIRKNLHKQSRFLTVILLVLLFTQMYYVNSTFINPDYTYNNMFVTLLPILIWSSVFSFSTPSDHEELDKNQYNVLLLDTIGKIGSVYSHYYQFTSPKFLEEAQKLNDFQDFNIESHIRKIIIYFLSNSNLTVPLLLICFLLNKRDYKYIFLLFKRLVYFATIISLLYLVYSPGVSHYFYNKLIEILPQHQYIVVYNSLPSQDTRYRLLVIASMWAFNQ